MSSFYLRAEGVNLSQILDDTQDLSTIRGSSLMLLNVIDQIEGKLAAHAGSGGSFRAPERIMSGASIGLWRIDADDEKAAGTAAELLREWLAQGAETPNEMKTPLNAAKHATFVIDVLPDDGNPDSYITTRERLMAMNRWQQMRTPSFIYPEGAPPPGSAKPVCDLDLKRPAKPDPEPIKGDTKAVSWSVWHRRGYGLKEKQKFYRRELEHLKEKYKIHLDGEQWFPVFPSDDSYPFPLHFASIAEANFPALRQSVASKIAVFYADGNQFAKLIDTVIGDPNLVALGPNAVARQMALNEALKTFRRDFLLRLLWTLITEGATGLPDKDEITERGKRYPGVNTSDIVRVETLLWGGDEFLFVVPARLGWRVAQLFFDTVAGRDNAITTLDGKLPKPEAWQLGGKPLHHAAGLIFCHQNAPIARIRKLAKDGLAESAKDCDRSRSLILPLVLESFDHIGADLDHFWSMRCPKGLTGEQMVLPEEALGLIQDAARSLASPPAGEPLPRRRLKALARSLHGEPRERGTAKKNRLKGLENDRETYFTSGDTRKAVDMLAPSVVDLTLKQSALIYYLEELWDYLMPMDKAQQ
jgi:hypothetical protein